MKKWLFSFVIATIFLAGEIPLWANAGTIKTNITSWNGGSVTVGLENYVFVTITNTSSISVTVSSIPISGSTEFGVYDITLPKAIPPHGTASFEMTFSPTAAGGATGTLTVVSTAINKPTISISGNGIQHSVSLSWGASSSASDPCYQNIGYETLRGTTSGGPYTPILASVTSGLSYVDLNVVSGTTYYYVEVATGDYVNGSNCPGPSATGETSAYSNETAATIP